MEIELPTCFMVPGATDSEIRSCCWLMPDVGEFGTSKLLSGLMLLYDPLAAIVDGTSAKKKSCVFEPLLKGSVAD